MLFSLGRRRARGGQGAPAGGQGKGPGRNGRQAKGQDRNGGQGKGPGRGEGQREPIGGAWPGEKSGPPPAKDQGQGEEEPIPGDIDAALRLLAARLHYPDSQDLTIRKFLVDSDPPRRAFLVYYEGLADTKRIEREILHPLMRLPRGFDVSSRQFPERILNSLLPAASVTRKRSIEELIAGVVTGEAAVVLDGVGGIIVDIKNPPARQPGKPTSERAVRGPQLGFTESHRVNTAMIRLFIRDPDLILERFSVGRRTMTPISIMYISDIANPRLVAEVRHRLRSLDVESILDSGALEMLIEDHPVTPVPLVMNTERPDRLAFEILRGAVGIIVGSSTRSLAVPVNFATLLHTAEDIHIRAYYASFLRIIRVGTVTAALLLPGAFVAILNYHQEMIPGQLLLVLAAARAMVPLPLIGNILIMELGFELIREAGLRIPSAIGPSIGIVGALLLGDMAVRSGLVTPSVVITVAVTALASLSIPDPATALAVRVGRFIFLALGGTLGFFGLALGTFALGVHLASLRSFGVPFLSPIGPWRAGSLDVILRGPIWTQEMRPIQFRPLDLFRQAKYARAWDPGVPAGSHPAETGSDASSEDGRDES